MFTLCESSKYQFETISIIVSFEDVFVINEQITGTPTITVTPFAGDDSAPSNLLYQGASVTNGDTVEQRFKFGVPGNIYTATFKVVTTAGNTYEKEVFLAILPTEGTAIPELAFAYLSSCLYPQQHTESLKGNAYSVTGGRLYQQVHQFLESLTSNPFTVSSGTLTVGRITYSYAYSLIGYSPNYGGYAGESLANTVFSIIGGSFTPSGLSYSNTYESLQGNFAIIGGTFTGSGITYSNTHESLANSTFTVTGGTLA